MPIAVIYITAAMLFFGAAPLPYGYYMLLRIIVTGVLIWASIIAHERKREVLPWIYGLGAILFNPIIKIYLPKEFWAVIDIGFAILLLSTKSSIVNKK